MSSKTQCPHTFQGDVDTPKADMHPDVGMYFFV